MHTAFVTKIPAAGEVLSLEKRERDHLFKILRCRIGDEVRLADGKGMTALALAEAGELLRITRVDCAEPRTVRLHLYSALPRNAKLDTLLKPAAETGVDTITPLKCRYSVSEKDTLPERWTLLLEEGCKQSSNPFLPELCAAKSVAAAIAECQTLHRQIYFGAQFGKLLQCELLPQTETLDLAWFVGPEGGFDEAELALLSEAGTGISVGRYIYRLENAALVGAAMLWACAAMRENHRGAKR